LWQIFWPGTKYTSTIKELKDLVRGAEIPEGDISAGEIPEGAMSAGDIPEGDISEGEIPEGAMSAGDILEGDISEGEIPEGGISEGGIPEGGIPEGSALPLDQNRPGRLRGVQGGGAVVPEGGYRVVRGGRVPFDEAGTAYLY